MSRALIVGGTNGLGRELALTLAPDYEIAVAGRTKRDVFNFFPLSLSAAPKDNVSVAHQLNTIAKEWPCDLIVYAAGFYQEGRITDLSDNAIADMMLVGVSAPAMLLSRYLGLYNRLDGFIAITSSSQWTPRKLEPVYTASKAGLGMLARSLAEDGRINKTFVAGPTGMKTPFWDGTGKDTKEMLDPKWVAEQIVGAYAGSFRYRFIKIHRCPSRVEIADTVY